MLDARHFAFAVHRYAPQNEGQLGTANTDWFDLVDRTGFGQEHNAAISGAGSGMDYRVSLNFLDQKGIIRHNNTRRISLGANYNQRLADDRLSLRFNLRGTRSDDRFTPLGVLSNAAELIEVVGADQPRLHDATRLIRRQVKYLASLVDDLLELGRARAAKIALDCRLIDIRACVEAAVESSSAALRERNQSVEIIVPSLEVECDPTRMRQVFVNLLSNASKFSPEGSRVWVKGTTEGGEAVLRVEDEGHGIPPELLPRVFDLFAQGAPVTQGRPGMGLGLTLVKEYVELHHGRVQVRSDGSGRGSEFIVRLPLRQGAPIR